MHTLGAYAGGVSIGNRYLKEIDMLASGYNGPNVRRARAMRARVLGLMVRRTYAAMAALRRRQLEALRKAAALDELAHRSPRMLGDIGLQPGDLLQMRHGPR